MGIGTKIGLILRAMLLCAASCVMTSAHAQINIDLGRLLNSLINAQKEEANKRQQPPANDSVNSGTNTNQDSTAGEEQVSNPAPTNQLPSQPAAAPPKNPRGVPHFVPAMPDIRFGQTMAEVIAQAPNTPWDRGSTRLSATKLSYVDSRPTVENSKETETILTFGGAGGTLSGVYSAYKFKSVEERAPFIEKMDAQFKRIGQFIATQANGDLYCSKDATAWFMVERNTFIGGAGRLSRIEITSGLDCSKYMYISDSKRVAESLRTKRIGAPTTKVERSTCIVGTAAIGWGPDQKMEYVDRLTGESRGPAPSRATVQFSSIPTNVCRMPVTVTCKKSGTKATLNYGEQIACGSEVIVE